MHRFLIASCFLAAAMPVAIPAVAQERSGGRVAESAVGQVGQRQLRDRPVTGVAPTARIDGRIQSRVQSRIRSRIDRNYDPQANAASPFVIAGDEARTANRAGRR